MQAETDITVGAEDRHRVPNRLAERLEEREIQFGGE